LFANRASQLYTYLAVERRIDPKVLKKCEIGWDVADDAYTIPLHDEDGRLENVKWWRPEWSSRLKKRGRKEMWLVEGRRSPLLFPTYSFTKRHRVYICEGEVDAMTLLTLGLLAITPTGGAGKWNNTWGPLFGGKEVIIIPDLDPDGRRHAQAIKQNLLQHAEAVRVLDWSALR
jgi:hypothetical protein